MDYHPWLGIAIISVLTFFDFFVSIAFAALEEVDEALLDEKAKAGSEKAALAAKFVDERNILFLNSAKVVLAASWFGSGIVFSRTILRSFYAWICTVIDTGAGAWVEAAAVAVTVLYSILLVFVVALISYSIPVKIGVKRSDRLFLKYFGLMRFITAVFGPFTGMLEALSRGIIGLFGIRYSAEDDNVTEAEIISIVNEGQEQGILEEGEAKMISNIISFDEKQAHDIMTHRSRMIAVNSEMGIEAAMRFMSRQSFSRFPLYTGDIDNIVGVIHLKDVTKAVANGRASSKKLIDIARTPLFVPDTMNISDLFHEMQSKSIHMTIAIDEYGQTAGIVAMEDILEEIVGNIRDEFDHEEEPITPVKDGEWICLGEAELEEVCEKTGLKPEEDDEDSFDTLNGLVISILDRIPADGETATVEYCGYTFEILETRRKMIRRVKVTKNQEPAAADSADGTEDD